MAGTRPSVFRSRYTSRTGRELAPTHPAVDAQKKASRGMFWSLAASAVFCGLGVAVANLPVLQASARCWAWVPSGLALGALGASAAGLYFVIRYALLLPWPARSRR